MEELKPVAFAVYWGLGEMRKNSVHFDLESAQRVAAQIKSHTEIRPLFAAPPAQQPQAEVVLQWQPIETAPKDETPIILGYAPDGDDADYVGQGRWHEEDHDGPDNMGHDAGFMDDRFEFFRCARSFGVPAYQHQGTQPTHWMPLPPAPQPT